jgi:hypothetical protein
MDIGSAAMRKHLDTGLAAVRRDLGADIQEMGMKLTTRLGAIIGTVGAL